MTIKQLIKELQGYKDKSKKVLITIGNEDEDTLSTSEFELCNKDETYDYIEIFINEDTCSKQLLKENKMYQKEFCPECYTELEHIKLSKEDVFGCPKCKKEITREEANKINIFAVICACNTEVEVEEHSVTECFNCGRAIDDRGVI